MILLPARQRSFSRAGAPWEEMQVWAKDWMAGGTFLATKPSDCLWVWVDLQHLCWDFDCTSRFSHGGRVQAWNLPRSTARSSAVTRTYHEGHQVSSGRFLLPTSHLEATWENAHDHLGALLLHTFSIKTAVRNQGCPASLVFEVQPRYASGREGQYELPDQLNVEKQR